MFRKLISFGIIVISSFILVLGSTGFLPTAYAVAAPVPSQSSLTALGPAPLSMANGFGHTCVMYDNGTVKCWGSNRYGQLGSSLLTLHPFPISVTNLAGTVTAIDAGAYHTCALITGGTIQCWGLNSSGQLGNGTTNNSPSPVTVTGLSNVTQIASGYVYTCVLINGGLTSGSVECWGDNTYGQLGGPPSIIPVTAPVAVAGLPAGGVAAIATSLDHTCALMNDHLAIYCWGKNTYGQLGNGTVSPLPSATPVPVSLTLPPGTTITTLSAGAQQTCALLSTGKVYCWGDGISGQIGNGLFQTVNSSPVLVSNMPDAIAISSGGYADTGHTCALTSAHGVVCWGNNAYGQLGDGTESNRNIPVFVSGLTSGVLSIRVGVNHSCAFMNDLTARCWGSDGSGQLGDGVVSISTKPIDSGGFTGGVTQVGTGDRNTCALVNGQVWCWGSNHDSQLVGDGSTTNRPAPVQVSGLTGTVTAIDSGMNQSCAIVNGAVKCWGNLDPTTNDHILPTTIGSLASLATSLSVTNLFGCAVANGAVRCWGDNSKGQLGDGSTTASYLNSVAVGGLSSGVTKVITGQWFACALKSDQTVWCWGDNTAGQLGNDPAAHPTSSTPFQVAGLSLITSMAAGQDHACALNQNGSVSCWGNNGQGQLGNGSQTTTFSPVQVSTLTSGVTAITAGGYHTCALVNGTVSCWGFNSFGQLGNNLTILRKEPTLVSGLSNGIIAVIAGGINYDQEQTCAITNTGQLKCWGGNEYGQLGDNLPIQRTTPVRVLGLTQGPEMGVNYPSGKPGSYFRVAVANFSALADFPILINGQFVGLASPSSEGYAIFHIKVNSSLTATLPITTAGLTTNLSISQSNSLNPQEGSGSVYADNTSLYYLPSVTK